MSLALSKHLATFGTSRTCIRIEDDSIRDAVVDRGFPITRCIGSFSTANSAGTVIATCSAIGGQSCPNAAITRDASFVAGVNNAGADIATCAGNTIIIKRVVTKGSCALMSRP
ncbi:hypothetical protein MGU_10568 [Metarhizium guizhouense ARSEF 977]|uniref:Uncharacterized protein n=1 Tax=Metarhizium guizhouense (strain ARSEF 977) TaxID=1276136 RepID=A0A0B4GI06_METGA|nr:hypothetical protein MGU_10568 [Metarhizium guizhouense ARSEF 977]